MRARGKGRMRLDAAVEKYRAYCGEIQGLMRRARDESWSHDRLTEEQQRHIVGDPDFIRLPGYLQRQIFEYMRGAMDVLYTCELVRWQLYLDGKRVSREEVPRGAWCRVDTKACRFEWAHSGEPY